MPYTLATTRSRLQAHFKMQVVDCGFVRAVYNNFYALPGGLYRCSQPNPGQICRYQARLGIKTIINLRGPNDSGGYALEREVCAQLGIALVDQRLYSRDLPTAAEILAFRDLFANMAYPALMHCKSGADRAGLGATLYRHFQLREPIAQIRELALKYGHFTGSRAGILDYFLAAYLAHQAREAMDFLTWVKTRYDRATLVAQYEAEQPGNWFDTPAFRKLHLRGQATSATPAELGLR